MSFFTIENIFVSIFSLLQAAIIFRYQKSKTHIIWSIFNLVVATWAFYFACVGMASNEKLALLYWKLLLIPIPFIAVVFYHFIISYCKLKRSFIIKLCYLYAITFSGISCLTNLVVIRAPYLFNSIYYYQANNLFTAFFFFWVIIVIMAFVEFHFYINRSIGLQKTQSKYIFWSMLSGFLGGTSSVLPEYGIMLYPFLQISIIFYILSTSYAIFKYDVIPISIVIKRSLVYSFLVTSVTIIYFVGVLILQHLFDPLFVHKSSASSIALLTIISIIFIPLKNKIQYLVDKYVLKNSPIEIAVQNENLRSEVAQTEKFKTLANLASMIVHEIKNPLSVMTMYIEKLKDKKDVPGFIEESQMILIGEIERINIFIQELLVYSKPSEPKIAPMNPNDIIKQVYHLVQTKCESLSIDIFLQQKTEMIIYGDPNLIKQAVLNLVLNAIEAMPQGGKLTITTEIDIKISPLDFTNKTTPKTKYCISISDTGCGIDQKNISLIFDPFYTNKKNGTGLGLPITQGIIEKHGGKIEVTSRLNEGTTFNIILGKLEESNYSI